MSEFKLVPVVPTPEMIRASIDACTNFKLGDFRDEIRYKAMLEAAPPQEPEPIQVKQLVWRDVRPSPFNGVDWCETVFSSGMKEYSIILNDANMWRCFVPDIAEETLEQAKAACQADYEERIRSALCQSEVK